MPFFLSTAQNAALIMGVKDAAASPPPPLPPHFRVVPRDFTAPPISPCDCRLDLQLRGGDAIM